MHRLFIGCIGRRIHVPMRLSARAVSGSNDAYAVLGVPRTADADAIKAAFRAAAKRTHPDLVAGGAGVAANPHAAVAFVRVVLAYETLSDPQRRAAYDAQYPAAAATRHHTAATHHDAPRHTSTSDSSRTDPSVVADAQWGEDESRPLGGAGGVRRRAAEAGPDSVWSALAHALDGPAYRGGVSDFPYALELEERNDPGGWGTWCSNRGHACKHVWELGPPP